MEIRSLGEDIWEITDFLSEEEQSIFLFALNFSASNLWKVDETAGVWSGRSVLIESFGNLTIKNVALDVEQRLSSLFTNYTFIHQLNHFLRASEGQGMDVHTDNVEPPDKVNMFGIVIYLNDDYEGGEIYYPEIGLSHKPLARSMVVHRASRAHGVHPVTGNNVRYVMTSFVKGDASTKFKGE